MGLGIRQAGLHDTARSRKVAVVSEDYADFAVGQHVMTCDGFPGIVAAVEDGPHPGTEAYLVTLDGGLGGGEYRTAQLSPIDGVTASGTHTAVEDYPELADILVSRPDIARD